MTTQMRRPEEFEASKREKFCALVGVGLTRSNAAASVGLAPSTVTRQMAADPLFAEQVRDAETECELDLMKRVRLQSERSWRAAVWLLERMRPERYARGKSAPAAPNWDDMFDQFVGLIDQEVADPAVRERLTRRLDEMVLAERVDVAELDGKAPTALGTNGSQTAGVRAEQPRVEGGQAAKHAPDKAGIAVPAGTSPSAPVPAGSSPLPAGRIEELLGHGAPVNPPNGRAADFCNTSPDRHEKRSLDKVCR